MPVIPEIPIGESPPKRDRIAWHIENAFVRVGKRVFNSLSKPLQSLVSYALSEFLELVEPSLISLSRPILIAVRDMPGMDTTTKKAIDEVLAGKYQTSGVVAVIWSILGIMGLMSGPASIIAKASSYVTDQHWRTARPAPDALWAMIRRGAISETEFDKAFAETGWSESLKGAWGSITKTLLSESDLISNLLRGRWNEGEFKTELYRRGYMPEDANDILALMWQIPGPGDLIRMAVREAWNETIAREFKYDEDFPVEFGEWTAKQGLAPEWAKRYWRAHWELPGIREGFELLHRREINEAQLKMLLRARDLPEFWRQRLINISYSPYTRVDIRRMYDKGYVDANEVYENYLDLGYAPDRARKLTDWTIGEYGAEQRDLLKGEILSAYKDDLLRLEEARKYLSILDYGVEEVEILIDGVDIKKQQAYEKELIENVRLSFIGGVIEENAVFTQLNEINPPSGFVVSKLKIWRLQRDREIARLTKAEIKAFFTAGIIDAKTADAELSRIGVSEQHRQWFKVLWGKKE